LINSGTTSAQKTVLIPDKTKDDIVKILKKEIKSI